MVALTYVLWFNEHVIANGWGNSSRLTCVVFNYYFSALPVSGRFAIFN